MSEVNHVVKRRLRVQKHRDYNGFKISLFALQPYPNFSAGAFFTKVWIAFLLPIRVIWTIKLFVNRKQIRFLNSKDTDLDWYYFWHHQKLKLFIRDILFTSFVKKPCDCFCTEIYVCCSYISILSIQKVHGRCFSVLVLHETFWEASCFSERASIGFGVAILCTLSKIS